MAHAIWLTSPFFVFDVPFVFKTDRDNTYQVVRDENLYNVVRYSLFWFVSLSVVVQEDTELIEEATSATCGERARNVLELAYGERPFHVKFGWYSTNSPLSDIVDDTKSGAIKTIEFPSPVDITGETDFIRFLDDDIRIVTHGGSDSVYLRQEFVTSK